MPARSLRARLLRVLLPPVTAVLGLGAIAAFFIALGPARDAYDQALIDIGLELSQHVRRATTHFRLELPPAAERALRFDRYDTIYYSVVAPDGTTLAGDAGLPPIPPGHAPIDRAVAYDGSYRGSKVRVVALTQPCAGATCTILVAETTHKRNRLARDIVLSSVVPELTIALLALAVVWFGVKRGLGPLEGLSREIKARSPRDLRPVDARLAPEEAKPLVEGLNQLLERLAEASRNQQRFLANAAHQLRTPLAGLQAHAELALAQRPGGALRDELELVRSATVRTARLAGQLLALARAEPGGIRRDALERVDLRRVVEQEADDWVHRALDKEIDLGFELSAALVEGDALLLRECIANLIHNAIEYTPRGGRVTVRTGSVADSGTLEVEDNGPGIPPQERERVFERFYRPPASPGTGSGLGLAIVREIALAHGARAEIGSGAQDSGCRITLRFPAPPKR